MIVSIRRVSESSVSRICLLTAAAGYSAEDRHEYGEFTGLVYSVLPRKYERVAEETWWPALRAKCPVEGPEKISEKEADFRYISLFKNMHTAVEEHIAFSPPHIHTDILRGYQRQGWGKKLIEKTAKCMYAHRWLMGPKNEKANLFYRRLGFENIQGSGTNMGLQFGDWKE